jgi:hypothetical protein
MLTRPINLCCFANLQQQLELLREERVVIVEIETEQRKRLDKRTSAGNDLSPALRDQIESCELLKDTDRIGGAQYGDGTGQADSFGHCSGSAEDDWRSRVKKLRPVMFSNTEDV